MQESGPLEADRIEVDEVSNEHTQPEAVQVGTKPNTATPANSPRSKTSSKKLSLLQRLPEYSSTYLHTLFY